MAACVVKITSEVQTEQKDAQGVITGLIWTKGTARKSQLVRVVAKMTGTCAAKIAIRFESNITTVDPRHVALVVIRETPPAPDVETCTKYKEVIFWASAVRGVLGDPAPEVTFKATADCKACDCAEAESTDEVKQLFS